MFRVHPQFRPGRARRAAGIARLGLLVASALPAVGLGASTPAGTTGGATTKFGCKLTAKLVGLKSESGVMFEDRVATLRCDAPKPKDPARTLRVYRGAGKNRKHVPCPPSPPV